MKPKEFKEALSAFLEKFDGMENSLHYARFHILRNIRKFDNEELGCLATDGVINHSDIPEDLRTEHSKFMASHE